MGRAGPWLVTPGSGSWGAPGTGADVGLYGTIRNPLAHDPKVEWDMTEQDTLDILTMISLVHRKLDQAYRFRP